MSFKRRRNILIEFVVIKGDFREVNEVGSYAGKRGKGCSCREPACVTPHYFYNRDRLDGVNSRIEEDFLRDRCDILRRRAETGGVIRAGEVVVDCFRNAHHAHFKADGGAIARELCNGIHRVVSADIEEVAYVVFFEDFNELFKRCGVVLRLREFFSARAESGGGGLFEEPERRLVRKLFAEIAEAFRKHSFDTVYRAVDFADAIGFHAPSYNAGQRCVYGSGRTAGLAYYSISDKLFHTLNSFQKIRIYITIISRSRRFFNTFYNFPQKIFRKEKIGITKQRRRNSDFILLY